MNMLFERLLHLEFNLLLLFSRHTIFLSLSVSGTQQTARMNDLGHGIDPHAVLPRLACQYTHTDSPCQYLRRPQNCSQTETLRQDFSRAKAHNKPGEDITKQTAEQLLFIACSYKKNTTSTSFQAHCNTVDDILQDIQSQVKKKTSNQIAAMRNLIDICS